MQKRIEQWLDQGMGRCLLRRTGFAAIVLRQCTTLTMIAMGWVYSVMPNHARNRSASQAQLALARRHCRELEEVSLCGLIA